MKVKIFASRILFILLPPNGYPFNQQGFGSPNIIGAQKEKFVSCKLSPCLNHPTMEVLGL